MLSQQDYDRLWQRPDNLLLTGQSSVIAIIDQPLWLDHPAYRDNLLDVQPINGAEGVSMHGPAVTSIAVGEVGVARDAKIVYRAIETHKGRESLLNNCADGLKNLQSYVEAGNHLDALSISIGWHPRNMKTGEDASKIIELCDWFEQRNIPVFSVTTTRVIPCVPTGIADYYTGVNPTTKIVGIPTLSRLLACPTPEDCQTNGSPYFRDKMGGLSWAVPFVAGMFALAREAQPGITRDEFGRTLRDTAQTVDFGEGVKLAVADIAAFAASLTPDPASALRRTNNPRFQR